MLHTEFAHDVYNTVHCMYVQVTATDVRLLRDIHQICRIPLDMGGGVRACNLCDPYAVILLVDGSVALLQLVESLERDKREETASLELTWPDIKVQYSMQCLVL